MDINNLILASIIGLLIGLLIGNRMGFKAGKILGYGRGYQECVDYILRNKDAALETFNKHWDDLKERGIL